MFQPELPDFGGRRSEVPQGDRALLLADGSGRLAGLLRQHQELLDKLRKKRREVERFREQADRHEVEAAARLTPLRDKLAALDREVHGLFAEIFKRRNLSRAVRTMVRALYEQLVDNGVISPGDEGAEDDEDPDAIPEEYAHAHPARPPESAPRGGNEDLRAMFLRLARALHPDKAQGGEDLAARTEAMKALNLAYEHGDLAGLLEIERRWSVGTHAAANDLESRCRSLDEMNRKLREQLKMMRDELGDLKRSDGGRMMRERKRAGQDPLSAVEQEGKGMIDHLTALRDHVVRFRDRKITIDEFVRGPNPESDDLADALEDFLETMMQAEPPAAPRTGRKKRKR
jgi:hypothetical protein